MKQFLLKIITFPSKFYSALCYQMSSLQNRYPCKLVGEKPTKEQFNTSIYYRMLGKSTLYPITLQKLLNDPELVKKFNTLEGVKFGAVAMGDILMSLPEEERLKKYEEIKRKMLDSDNS